MSGKFVKQLRLRTVHYNIQYMANIKVQTSQIFHGNKVILYHAVFYGCTCSGFRKIVQNIVHYYINLNKMAKRLSRKEKLHNYVSHYYTKND